MTNLIKISGVLLPLLFTACGGSNGEPIILPEESTSLSLASNQGVDIKNYLDELLKEQEEPNQSIQITGSVVDLDKNESSKSDENETFFVTDMNGSSLEKNSTLKEDENLSDIVVVTLDENLSEPVEVIVNDSNTSYGVEILSGPKKQDIKSAQYYSVDVMGKVLDFKLYGKDDFYYENDTLSLSLKPSDEEFYSHLTVVLENGNSVAFVLRDGVFTELPLTITLEQVEEGVDAMSDLHSLSFKASTTKMIDPAQLLSFQAIINNRIVDSNYNQFADTVVYEWGPNNLFMKSFALGYKDSNISKVAICLELQAVPEQQVVCSNMLLLQK